MSKKPIIIDTDPGDDDATSILWAIATGIFDIKALTITYGNVDVDKCVINALRVLEAANRRDIPVYEGAYRPLVKDRIDAAWIHGSDGLGDAKIEMPKIKKAKGYAPIEIARIIKESSEPVTILSLGPLTNVALALLLDRDFSSNVDKIIFMGGAVKVSGNESPRASFNVATDPEAAHIVYTSDIPVIQIGLDVCDLVTQTVDDLDKIGACHTPVTDFLLRILEYRRTKAIKLIKDAKGNIVKKIKASDQVKSRNNGIGLNDLTATAYAINPNWFKTIYSTIDIEISGALTKGETIVDYMGLWGRKPNAYFAYDVDGKQLVSKWVEDMCEFKP